MTDHTEKQEYLRENILDKGADVNKFIEYIATVKPDGENIDNWKMDELVKAVDEYKLKRASTLKTKVQAISFMNPNKAPNPNELSPNKGQQAHDLEDEDYNDNLSRINSEIDEHEKDRFLTSTMDNTSAIIICDTIKIAAREEDINVAKDSLVVSRPSINLLSKNYISKAIVNDYYAIFHLKKYPHTELLKQKN